MMCKHFKQILMALYFASKELDFSGWNIDSLEKYNFRFPGGLVWAQSRNLTKCACFCGKQHFWSHFSVSKQQTFTAFNAWYPFLPVFSVGLLTCYFCAEKYEESLHLPHLWGGNGLLWVCKWKGRGGWRGQQRSTLPLIIQGLASMVEVWKA